MCKKLLQSLWRRSILSLRDGFAVADALLGRFLPTTWGRLHRKRPPFFLGVIFF
jgi:hypothetical protein